ncbi:hypothetical protein GRI89_11645 [Altererythrobacter salegens]|uniref:Uncharacterized protein n=2 Tax=Croceibacterium salegens TaxID=1737568 RepID=A0A6I4T0M5_9SPHN|nr:hypothetical protein [Croceibacterium salegens]
MDVIFSVVVLAAFALLGGAWFQWRREGAVKQVWLMALLAVIMLANVALWTVPDKNGAAPMDRAEVSPE